MGRRHKRLPNMLLNWNRLLTVFPNSQALKVNYGNHHFFD